ALVLSGLFPAAGVIIGIIAHRRVDVVGILVLAGIAAGAILGLVSHNARLVLDEGSVPTLVFGLICLRSLATPKPLIYRLALEFIGPDSRQGREFTDLWQYQEFRRIFRVITAVWGTAYLAEAAAAARVVIVQNASAGTALAIAKILPYAVAGVLIAWTVGYGGYQKRRGERLAAAAAGRADAHDVHPGNQPAPETLPARTPALGTAVSQPGVGPGDWAVTPDELTGETT
ncbi:MAG: VC0807 family protein, partial [Streptosporangiaceae bacterium]